MILTIDVQTDRLIPDDGNLTEMKIIAVSVMNEEKEINTWVPKVTSFGCYGKALSSQQVNEVIKKLTAADSIISWNGLSFDLKILYQNSSDSFLQDRLKKIAKKHIDLAYAFLCEHGYMISMKKVILNSTPLDAKSSVNLNSTPIDAQSFPSLRAPESQTIDAQSFPSLWAAGSQGQQLVLDANRKNVEVLLLIYTTLCKHKALSYKTNSGNTSYWKPIMFNELPLSVRNASMIDLPDNSFLPEEMQEMFCRERFNQWIC